MTVIREEYSTVPEVLEPYEDCEPVMLLMTAVAVQGSGVIWHCHTCQNVEKTSMLLAHPICHEEPMHLQFWQSLGCGVVFGQGFGIGNIFHP